MCLAARWLFTYLREGFLLKRVNKTKHRLIRILFGSLINKEIKKASRSTVTFPRKKDVPVFDVLPAHGMPPESVVALSKSIHSDVDHNYETGGISGCVYHGGKEHTKLMNEVMEIYQWSNPLHVDVFGSVRQMEAEIVSMVVDMYKGRSDGRDACGALTSGGTESIMMAIKTYRDYGRAVLHIESPEIVLPVTAHPAFDKGSHYYGVRLVKVPVDMKTGAVDPALLEKYITSSTVAIAGSAPNFPYGAIDPIEDLAMLAHRRGICMHVDACLGGFIVPFMEEAGIKIPNVDFRNPGVTSISCDTHKFGFAPKGTSVIMYRSKELRRYQYFTISDWPGGIYCSPGAPGSRAGNVIVGAWATLLSIGRDGYVSSAKSIVLTAKKVATEISTIPQLRVLGRPQASVVAFTSDVIDIFSLGDALRKHGWMLNSLQFPSGLQFCITLLQTQPGVADRFVSDLKTEVKALFKVQQALLAAGDAAAFKVGKDGASMYGSQQRIGDRSIINEVLSLCLDGYYDTHA